MIIFNISEEMLNVILILSLNYFVVVTDSAAATAGTSGISTKVLYFTEKTVTPFLTSIPRK